MIIQVLILIAGFLLLVKGADWFVDGAASLAERMGIPQLVVGLTIVAMGTSMPEAAVSIASALKNNPEIAIGIVRFKLSFKTVFAQGNSSHAVKKLKIDTEAIPGFARGIMILPKTVKTLPPSI